MLKWILTYFKKPNKKKKPTKKTINFVDPVVAFNPRTQKIIKLTTHDHAKQHGFNISSIYECLHKRKIKHKGYYFIYLAEPFNCRCVAVKTNKKK